MTTDTIFALSTPPGRSALAVIRLSGSLVRTVLETFCRGVPEPRRAVLRRIVDPADGALLDEALILFFAGPRSETGEDMAELQVHGGRAVIQSILSALARIPGCRPAEPGEFARRGLENGKLDLAQVEGLADLIDAETEAQRRQAISGASGAASAVYANWRSQILSALALVEAAIDFSDEADVADATLERAEAIVRPLTVSLGSHLTSGNQGEILREGFRVVLAGPPNAGKSSLLNALARREAAIVSEEAGTTRDTIEVRLDLGGWPVVVTDTAGIRQTTSVVEREGIRRTIQAARRADLVAWLVEPGGAPEPTPNFADADIPVITVETKSDLLTSPKMIHVKHESPGQEESVLAGKRPGSFNFSISTVSGAGLENLVSYLASRAREATGRPGDAVITRVRHRREIEAAHLQLDRFLTVAASPLELRAENLRLAASAIGRLTGHIGAEEVLGEIFGRFCIGK